MKRSTRRGVAAGTIAAAVELGLASAGPLSWGLGCLLAAGLFAAGVTLWRDAAHVVDGGA